MASIDWPFSSIPILQEGFQYTVADNTVRFEPDVGASQVRRRSTSNPDYISFNMQMSREEAYEVMGFYKSLTVGGTLRFNFTNPITGDPCEARFHSPPVMSTKDVDVILRIELELL